MTLFQIPTSFLIVGLLYFVMPGVTWVVLSSRRSSAVALWCVSDIAFGLGVILLGLRGHVSEWATFPLTNLLLFIAIIQRTQSLRLDLAVPWRTMWMALAALFFVLGFESIRLGIGDALLRLQYNQLIWAVMNMYIAVLAWQIGHLEQSRSARWIAGVFLLLAVAMLNSLIRMSIGLSPPDPLNSNPSNIFLALAGTLAAVIGNIAYVGLAFERSQRQTTEAEKQYRTMNERVAMAAKVAAFGVWEYDIGTDLITWDSTMFDIYGIPKIIPMQYQMWVDRLHPEDRLRVERSLQAIINEHGREDLEYRIIRPDNSIRYIQSIKTALKDDTHQTLRIIGVNRDITEEYSAEQALRESNARYDELVRRIPVGVYTLRLNANGEANFAYASEKLCQMFGLTEQDILHDVESVYGFIHPDDRTFFDESNRIAAQTFEPFRWEGRIQLRWETRWLCIESDSTALPNGESLWNGVVIDITERKQAEAALRESEVKFRLAFSNANTGMCLVDTQGKLLQVNRKMSEIFGYSQSELESMTVNDLVLPEDMHLSPDFIHHAVQGDGDSATFEKHYRHRLGHIIHAQVSSSLVRDAGGHPQYFISQVQDITERKHAEEEIKQLAFYDPLTQLPNRRLLIDRLQQALVTSNRSGLYGALLFIDLDNFKALNDTLGHDKGDLLLQEVAIRLAACVRECDTVARLGGDEFVVMLTGLDCNTEVASDQTEKVGKKLLGMLNRTYSLAEHEHYCSASIGITLFVGQGSSAGELLKQADIALYQAKNAGRNALRFFDPQMQSSITTGTALVNDLRHALGKNQFVLFYQIEVDHNGKLVGAEALLRWEHPKQGLTTPPDFILVAEETWLIQPIGQWVLESACAQLKSWERSTEWQHLYLAVNISVRQFHQPNFVNGVLEIVRDVGIDPGRLILELTESVILANLNNTAAKMNALKEVGVRFSLDDFGTGYSSLAHLTRLPFDQLKIDRSFVQNIGVNTSDTVVIKAIIAMAKELGISVVAEGVETEEQHDFLKQHGCPIFQGYLFGKPVQMAAFVENLKFNSAMGEF